jgi:hypothetical protein
MTHIIELSCDSGKEDSWKRWPDNVTTYTMAEAEGVIKKTAASMKRLKELNGERPPDTPDHFNGLERYQFRIAELPPEPPRDTSVLAAFKRKKI